MHKTGETVTIDFCTSSPTTGEAADATGTPTGTLVLNGTDNGATVTVTNKATGVYKAAVTLPTVTDGDELQLRIAATVGGVAGKAVIWTGVGVTVRPAEVSADVDALITVSAGILEDTGVSIPALIDALPTAAEVWSAGTRTLTSNGNDPTAAAIASAVRTELTTELGRIDAAVSSRLATASYTAAPTTSQIATAVFTTAVTESYRSAGSAPTVAQALCEMLAHMGDMSISGTTKTLKKIDGTTAKTFTLDSATTPTSITEAT
jgi:hypothetical protein